ncbi:hypothetical protein [Burkholderia anthina]|uniref:hypothetical protein n=1 Tax=Burkholderia anthina TaxID=179879 RepID=UPI001FB60AE1|nr:hypothetical protein [Burkholderia anthina]
MTTDKSRTDALTESAQFLTDVVTAASLLSHGRTDKKLAMRVAERAYELRTHMHRLAASPVEQHDAAPMNLKAQLRRAMDLLDTHLGDSDPMLEGLTQDEIEDEYPVVAAMQIVVSLHQEMEQPEQPVADERAANPIGYIRADDLKELADGNGAIVSPKCRETDVPVFARASSPNAAGAEGAMFQQRVQPWMLVCFGAEIAADRAERNHRFLEEALELVQACGCTASEAHQLVDYTFSRPVGEPTQEVGGAMVTLAALCLANGLDMHAAGETELTRVWTKVERIRAKQAAKPKHSPLPGYAEPCVQVTDAARDVLTERRRQVEAEGWTPEHDEKYRDHEMSCAAGCYAMYTLAYPEGDPPPAWPWAAEWWKPTTHRRNLIKAAALILAEIERIDRGAAHNENGEGGTA